LWFAIIATLPGAFDEGSNFGLQSFGFNLAAGAAPLSYFDLSSRTARLPGPFYPC